MEKFFCTLLSFSIVSVVKLDFVELCSRLLGGLFFTLSAPTVGSWWSHWVVIAVYHCYPRGTWWSDAHTVFTTHCHVNHSFLQAPWTTWMFQGHRHKHSTKQMDLSWSSCCMHCGYHKQQCCYMKQQSYKI